jgi:SAM-dependent methyltransferase
MFDFLQKLLGFPYVFVADQITAALPECEGQAAPNRPIVLDIGCGTARVLRHLNGVRYIGLDPSKHYLASARARFPHAEFHLTSFQDFDTSELCGRVDVVVTSGVLHHIDDPDVVSLCRTVSKILRPHGSFVSFDPALIEGQHRLARLLAQKDRGNFVRTPSHLEALLSSVWKSADIDVRHDLRPFPYTHVVARARL